VRIEMWFWASAVRNKPDCGPRSRVARGDPRRGRRLGGT